MTNSPTHRVLDLHSSLSEHTRAHIQTIHTWAKKNNLERLISHHWEKGTLPPHIISSFLTHCPQLVGFTIPKTYGGTELDLLSTCLVVSTLASIDASFTTSLLVQYGLVAEALLLCGTEEQKRRFLPGIATFDIKCCFCLTEPQSGSDASDLRTSAFRVKRQVRVGRNGEMRLVEGYVITGKKRWIGNAGESDIFVVWAKNMSLPGHPVMGFIINRNQQQHPNAITTKKIEGKISMRMVQNADVTLTEAWCPDENVMHEYVGFSKSVGRVLGKTRVHVFWIPVGVSMGALDHVIQYVTSREAFNAPLSSHQLIQEKLTRMTAMVSSIYLLAERVTIDFGKQKCGMPAIAMAKAYNSRVGRDVVALAREMMGGNGVVLEYQVASKFADMESIFTYEGTYDINALVCGRAITGVPAFKSGLSIKNEYTAKSKL